MGEALDQQVLVLEGVAEDFFDFLNRRFWHFRREIAIVGFEARRLRTSLENAFQFGAYHLICLQVNLGKGQII